MATRGVDAEADEDDQGALPPERVRQDALPDHTDYRDTGCDLAPSCLRCPFARCKYDERGGSQRMTLQARDREIARRFRRDQVPVDMLADTFGVTERTVFRILKSTRH